MTSHDQEFAFAQLAACLALVRPVGMTEADTMDWLAVAADTVSHLPPPILEAGCRRARQSCRFPSEIVPAIIEATREDLADYHRPKLVALPAPEKQPAVDTTRPPPDPNTLMPDLKRMGVERGWIIELPDGSLAWAEDNAA